MSFMITFLLISRSQQLNSVKKLSRYYVCSHLSENYINVPEREREKERGDNELSLA